MQMSFIDPFLDKLSDIADDVGKGRGRRYSDGTSAGGRYAPDYPRKKKRRDDDDLCDLTRYEGLYKENRDSRRVSRMPSFMADDDSRGGGRGYDGGYRGGYRFSGAERRGAGDIRFVDDEDTRADEYRRGASVRRGHLYDGVDLDSYETDEEYYRRPKKRRRRRNRTALKLLLILLLMGFIGSQIVLLGTVGAISTCGEEPVDDSPVTPDFPVVPDAPAELTEDEQRLLDARELVAGMTDEQKVGQLLLIRSHGASAADFAAQISALDAGGVVLFADDCADMTPEQVRAYTAQLQEAAGGSLLICVDEEGGSVVRLSGNRKLRDSKFRAPQALYASGGMELITSDTAEKCAFLKDLGVNVNLAPVADVVTDSHGFLFSRSFGRGAEETAEYVRTVVTVMKQQGMGSAIKHFPGYGNSSGDTHNGLVVLDTAEAVIRERDLAPFKAGIEAGADSVLVTHTVINAIDPVNPASLSPAVISMLRNDLGFGGVIMTDGLDMEAITDFAGDTDACVTALLAGADLMCTPADAAQSRAALLEAVGSGTIPSERLDNAVTRIVVWKLGLGMTVELPADEPDVSGGDVVAP